MSKYPSLLPDDLSSNEYIAADGTKYTVSASSLYNGEPHYPYQFFSHPPTYEYMDVYKHVGFTNVESPPHWICLSSSVPFVTDEFDFVAMDDRVVMTIKDYVIECSIDGDNWIQIYSGTVPSAAIYEAKCEYDSIICKHIRLKVLTKYYRSYYGWSIGYGFKVFGISSAKLLFEDKLGGYTEFQNKISHNKSLYPIG